MRSKISFGRTLAVISVILLIALGSLYFYVDKSKINIPLRDLPRVAHAGGGYKGQTYTNSIEALQANAENFELFEIDFSLTSDDQLACIHDWQGSAKLDLGKIFDSPPTFDEFTARLGMGSGLTNCTVDTLAKWLQSHPGKRIVTDVKDDNLKALNILLTTHPEMRDVLIPQIYHPDEYSAVKKLGFKNIILTLYRCGAPLPYILFRASFMDLYAVTIPINRAYYAQYFKKLGIPTYVHTINNREDFEVIRRYGVTEIYTDWLVN